MTKAEGVAQLYVGRVMFGLPVVAKKVINRSGDEVYEVLETGQHVYPQAFKQVKAIEEEEEG